MRIKVLNFQSRFNPVDGDSAVGAIRVEDVDGGMHLARFVVEQDPVVKGAFLPDGF